MDRRAFLYGVGAAAAVGTAAATSRRSQEIPAEETRTVAYQVKGFTCVTCAVGLETMLKQVRGVTRVTARYPESDVVIGFDDRLTSDDALRGFVATLGFSVA